MIFGIFYKASYVQRWSDWIWKLFYVQEKIFENFFHTATQSQWIFICWFFKPADISASLAKPADISASLSKPADISASLSKPAHISASLSKPALNLQV